jgi:hypothetical protein
MAARVLSAMFRKMIELEQKLCAPDGDFFVFYHSYSYPALLYEASSALRAQVWRVTRGRNRSILASHGTSTR